MVYRPHVLGENGHRERIFSKTHSSVEIVFEKRPLIVFMWTVQTLLGDIQGIEEIAEMFLKVGDTYKESDAKWVVI